MQKYICYEKKNNSEGFQLETITLREQLNYEIVTFLINERSVIYNDSLKTLTYNNFINNINRSTP